MIIFYRHKDCQSCEAIEDALKELAVPYKSMIEPAVKEIPAGTKLPVIVDGNRLVVGMKAIIAYLEELKGFIEIWYKYQSDVCYCDED